MAKDINNLLEKINRLKKEGKLDLSSQEDLSLAVMNLISLEEHFFFTGAKTGKRKYYDCLNQIRAIRQELLKKLVGESEGELYCVEKHLLAASMRLIEVGTKYQGEGEKKEAEDFFSKAWSLYSLFWGIKLSLVEVGELKKIDDKKINLQGKLNEIIKKLVDCCS
jgi:hypothetical protein